MLKHNKILLQVLKTLAKFAGVTPNFLKELIETGTRSIPVMLATSAFISALSHVANSKVQFIKPHPRQRDTKSRLKKVAAVGGHLHKTSLAHTEIVLAFFRGQLYLVDGNHRAMLWATYPDAERPSHVTLVIKLFADDEEEAFTQLYYAYDSKAALEARRQKMFGYMAVAGIAEDLATKFVRGGQFVTVFNHLEGYVKTDDVVMVAHWAREISLFDKDLAKNEKKYNIGIVAALLMLYRKHIKRPEIVSRFLEGMGAVQVIRELQRVSTSRTMSHTEQELERLTLELENVVGKNSESIIRKKRTITLNSFTRFEAAYLADTTARKPKLARKSRIAA